MPGSHTGHRSQVSPLHGLSGRVDRQPGLHLPGPERNGPTVGPTTHPTHRHEKTTNRRWASSSSFRCDSFGCCFSIQLGVRSSFAHSAQLFAPHSVDGLDLHQVNPRSVILTVHVVWHFSPTIAPKTEKKGPVQMDPLPPNRSSDVNATSVVQANVRGL